MERSVLSGPRSLANDFTLAAYRQLLQRLTAEGAQLGPMLGEMAGAVADWSVRLRHDVDRWPSRAAAMGRAEAGLGVRSTYYFRVKRHVFDERIISELSDACHEIGFHYESLADARGDMALAWDLFRRDLDRLRKLVTVKTIAMHGRPFQNWDSRDLWKHYDYRSVGLVSEAYLNIDWTGTRYFTDTGRCWNGTSNVRDRPLVRNALSSPRLESTSHLADFLVAQRGQAVVSSHPERWADGILDGAVMAVIDGGTNIAKDLLLGYRKLRPSKSSARGGKA